MKKFLQTRKRLACRYIRLRRIYRVLQTPERGWDNGNALVVTTRCLLSYSVLYISRWIATPKRQLYSISWLRPRCQRTRAQPCSASCRMSGRCARSICSTRRGARRCRNLCAPVLRVRGELQATIPAGRPLAPKYGRPDLARERASHGNVVGRFLGV